MKKLHFLFQPVTQQLQINADLASAQLALKHCTGSTAAFIFVILQEELKKEMRIQRSKMDKQNATMAREKKEFQAEKKENRQKLLAAFEDERKQREGNDGKEVKKVIIEERLKK